MAYTIGHRWPRGIAPRGDFAATCQDCGVRYRYSQLRRMPSGLLRCEGVGTNNCAHGREAQELDEANARAYRNRSRTPRQPAASFDPQEPLLLQRLSAEPVAFYALERVSSTYTDDLLRVRAVTGEAETDADSTDIGYRGNNWLSTEDVATACGVYEGRVKKWYDQSGYVRTLEGSTLQIWKPSSRLYAGFQACPAIAAPTGGTLEYAQTHGVSAHGACTLFFVFSGEGELGGFGGTAEGAGISITVGSTADPRTDQVYVGYNGHEQTFPDGRTLLDRKMTGLRTLTYRRTGSASIQDAEIMLDGEALSYNEPSGGDWDPNLLLAFDSVGLRVGSSGFRGHLYAFGIFDSYLTDADVELLETWAQDARALCYDSRGTRVGSRQP